MIKAVLFIVIALILIVGLVYFFSPQDSNDRNDRNDRNQEEAYFNPGTYSTKLVLGEDDSVLINVTVTSNRISNIEMTELTELQEFFYPTLRPAMNRLAMEVVRHQSVDVNVDIDNEMTERILLQGIDMALQDAKLDE